MPEDSKPSEIRALAGARALPPLLLVLYHYHEAHGYQNLRWFDVFVSKGYLWVEFFFGLSGFILIHVYGARTGFRYRAFLKSRLARLYPLHLFTLLLMLVMVIGARAFAAYGGYTSIYDLPGYHPYTSAGSFVGNLFLVQAWHLFPRLSWNGVAWFVSVEWFLCLIFPLFLWLSGRGLLIAAALIVFGFGLLRWLVAPRIGLDITYDWGILRGIGDFAIGVGLAVLFRTVNIRSDAWPEHWFSMAQIVVFTIFLYAVYATGWAHTVRDYWMLPPIFALIFVLAFDRGAGANLFQIGPLRVLGEWSFAIYMGQTTFLQLLRIAEQRLYPHPAQAWVSAIHLLEPTLLLLCCVAWGAALYYWVEQPASRWSRKALATRGSSKWDERPERTH